MVKLSKEVSQKLTNANVLFTILIVWLHVSADYNLPKWIIGIAVYSVPCFFAMSSFLYFRSFDFDYPWKSYKSKVWGRFKSLIVPFIIFNIVGFLFKLLYYKFHPVGEYPLVTLLDSNPILYLLKSNGNGPLWYLGSLFEFILVAPILGYIIRLSIWTILLLPFIYWFCIDFNYYLFPYWMVDLFIGAYMALYYEKLLKFNIIKNIQLGGAFFSSLLIVLGCFGIIDVYTCRAMAPLCFLVIYKQVNIIPRYLVQFLAPYTLLIYCLHVPISRIAIRVPMVLHISIDIVSLIISTIVTILIILVIGKFVKKNKKVWSVITGGR